MGRSNFRFRLSAILLFAGFALSAKEIPLYPRQLIKVSSLQHRGIAQSTEDPEAICPNSEVIIPIKRVGRLLIIEAQVDTLRGNFIFDTGAQGLTLNNTYFRNYRTLSGYIASGSAGGLGEATVTDVGRLSFNGISYENVEASLADLSDIENARGIQILGLLGFNLFKSFEMEIDLSENSLRLVRCKKNGDPLKASVYTYDYEIPVSTNANILFVKTTMAKRSMLFAIDTGAEINVLRINAPKAVLETVRITGRSALKGAGNQTLEIITGRMGDFEIGGLSLLGMQTILTQLDDLKDAYGTPLDGILGYELLIRGRLKINPKKGEMEYSLFDKFNGQ